MNRRINNELVLLVCAGCLMASIAHSYGEDHFPTEDHKRYPLTIVETGIHPNPRVTDVVPYKEPAFLGDARAQWSRFAEMQFPIPEDKSDVTRYFTGTSVRNCIPQGHNEVSSRAASKESSYRFVHYANGIPKNIYSRWGGVERLNACLLLDEKAGVVIKGLSPKTVVARSELIQFPVRTRSEWHNRAPIRTIRFDADGRTVSYEIYKDGKPWRKVRVPETTGPPPGEWPSQALRFQYDLPKILSDSTLSDAEKERKIMGFAECQPQLGEDDAGYVQLNRSAVWYLGKLKSQSSFEVIVKYLSRRDLRATATDALIQRGDRKAVPYLLDALALEDFEYRNPVKSQFMSRNRHMVSIRLAKAVLKLEPVGGSALVEQFLAQSERSHEHSLRTLLPQNKRER